MRAIAENEGVNIKENASITEIFSILRKNHPVFIDKSSHSKEIDKITKAFSTIIDSLNQLRNRGSMAHPNRDLLMEPEAMLCINSARTMLACGPIGIPREPLSLRFSINSCIIFA